MKIKSQDTGITLNTQEKKKRNSYAQFQKDTSDKQWGGLQVLMMGCMMGRQMWYLL